MAKAKITVTVDEGMLVELDQLVQQEAFESRSAAMEAAVSALLTAQAEAQYDRALAALTPADVAEMQALAEEGMADFAAGLKEYPW